MAGDGYALFHFIPWAIAALFTFAHFEAGCGAEEDAADEVDVVPSSSNDGTGSGVDDGNDSSTSD